MQSRLLPRINEYKQDTVYRKISFCNDRRVEPMMTEKFSNHFTRPSLKYPQTKTANYSCSGKKKIEMTFYIEQLFLLPGKLDETERQIIPFGIRPRNIVFIFRSRHLNFREFTKRQIRIIRFSAFVKIIEANDASSALTHLRSRKF